MPGLGTAFVNILPNMGAFAPALNAGVAGPLNTVGATIGRQLGALAGIGLAAVGVTSVAVAMRQVIDVGIEYERTLSVFKSVTQATGEQMAKTAEVAKQLGSDVALPGVSAAGAASAMTELAKAGLSVEQSQDAARGALALAIAAQTSEAEAAMITANALLTFGLQASEANRVTDLLAGAANASSASMTDIAYGLSMAGAAMQGAKVPIEDTITALTLMANAGIRGSDAGTLLKTAVTRMTAPTAGAKKVMDELGLSFYDANGNFVGMRSAVEQLDTVFSDMGAEQRAAAINTLFGADAMRFANIAVEQGAEKWDKYAGQVTRSGQAQELAAAQNAGLGGALDNLQSSLETVGLEIYERISPGLTDMVRGLNGAIDAAPAFASSIGAALGGIGALITQGDYQGSLYRAFGIAEDSPIIVGFLWLRDKMVEAFDNIGAAVQPLINTFKNIWAILQPFAAVLGVVALAVGAALVQAFVWLTAALEPIAKVLESVTGFLRDNHVWVESLVAAVAAFTAVLLIQRGVVVAIGLAQRAFAAALLFVKSVVGTVKVAMWLLNAAFAANPVGIIVAAIVALVAAFVVAYKRSETFRNIVDGAIRAVGDAFKAVVDWVKGTAWPWLQRLWQSISDGAMKGYNAVRGFVANVVAKFLEFRARVIATATAVFDWLKNAFMTITLPARWAIALVIAIFMWFWKQGVAIFTQVMTFLTGIWNSIRNAVVPVVASMVGTVMGWWNTLSDNVTRIVMTVWNWLRATWEQIKATVVTAVVGLYTQMVSTWNSIKAAVEGPINAVWGFLTGIFNSIVGFVTERVNTTKTSATNAFNGIKTAVTTAVSALWQPVSDAFNRVVSTIGGFVTTVRNKANEVFQTVKDAVTGKINDLYSAGKDMIQGFINGITGMATTLKNKVAGFIRDNVPGPVMDILGIASPSRLFMQYGRYTAEGLAIGIGQGASDVQAAAAGLANVASGAWDSGMSTFGANVGGASIHNAPPQVRVFIGDQELTHIVRTEVAGHDETTARAVSYGRVL